jgi:formylglycine-generating enzyme required for sulfatase activity
VTISQVFYMGKYEVTQAQYQAVMGTNPSRFKDPDKPVEKVSRNDAVAFCQTLSAKSGRSIRLPSEAEWEYACKADKGNVDAKYYFGDDENQLASYAWYDVNSGSSTRTVGTRTGNSFGLFDIYGNVWEWCQDVWHSDYTGAPTNGSAWTAGGDQTLRVLRGGSWHFNAYYCRSSVRLWYSPTLAYVTNGFRVVVGNVK